jgi:hypothetical protein
MIVKRKNMSDRMMYGAGGMMYGEGGKTYENGGSMRDTNEFPFRPPGPPTKEEAKFLRQQMAVDEGLRALMQRELRGRDKSAMRNNTPFESESAVLLEMLESGQLNRGDAMRKGKRRRLAKQAAPILGEMALASALGAGTLQNQHERQTGTRPNFGQALRMLFGGQ